MDENEIRIWAEGVDKIWAEVEALTPGSVANRLALGQRFHDLRAKYSDRNFGGHRLTSGHGTFEEEIRKRGYRPRSVREWISDYESALAGKPLSAAKRKTRRLRSRPSSPIDPLSAFAALLPFRAAHAAYREAAKIFHPDHGGNGEKMQQLNELWQQVKVHYQAQEV
jgi:hypothetical protein